MRRFPFLLLFFSAISLNAAVTGTVVTADGAPVAGARVRAYAREPFSVTAARLLSATPDPTPLAAAETNAEGRFSVDAKGNATVDVVVDAAGKVPAALFAADGDDAGAVILRDADKARRVKVTAAGKPLPNALLYLGHSLLVRTGADGMYDAAGTGEAPYVIHPDYGPYVAMERDGVVEVRRGNAMKGRVVARDGKTPVANATIYAGGWPLAQSGADGSFAIAHAPAPTAALLAVSGNDAGAASADAAKPVEIRLGTAASIGGSVTAVNGGPAIAGATIQLMRQGEIYSAISDAKGKYTIAALPPGQYSAQGYHPGYVPARVQQLRAGAASTESFALRARSGVRGIVLGEDKKPAAGVFVGPPFGAVAGSVVITPASGEFSIRFGTATTLPVVMASKNGYAPAVLPVPNLAPGEIKSGVTLTLQRGFPLQIKVVDPGHAPVANASVDILATVGAPPAVSSYPIPCSVADRGRCRPTGSDGTIETRLAEGKYDLRVSGDFMPKMLREQALSARSSPLVVTVERGADVSGRVLYGDGTPAAEVRVSTMSPMTMGSGTVTDANGAFTLKQLPRSALSLFASTDDQIPVRSAPLNVTPPATNVTLTIPTPARVEGRVIDRATSQPVTSFAITTQRRGPGSGGRAEFTSDDGTFVLKHVQPGVFELRVTAPGYVSGSVADLSVDEGKALTGVEVKLDRGARITGHVTGAGSIVGGVRVHAGGRNSRGTPNAVSDANGDYTLDGVAAGEVTVEFNKEGFVAKRKTIEVEAGKDVRLDADLDRGRELHGRVADKSGQAVGGARVSTSTPGTPYGNSVTTDDSGQFTLSGLEDGHYRVTAQKNGYVSATLDDVDAAAGQPLTLTLDRGATLTGRVTGLPAEELTMVHIAATSQHGSSSAQADASGNFTLTGIADGRVTVTGYRQGIPPRQSAPKTVDVMNGSAPPVEIDFSAGITIRGRVTLNGMPASNGTVMFMPKARSSGRVTQGMIAGDGQYEVTGAEPGDYDVRVNTAGSFNDAVPYTVSSSAVFDIDIRGSSLRGVVLDAASGAPLPDVRVFLTPTGPTQHSGRSAVTDSNGRFVLDVLPDGSYVVRADREHYAPASQPVTVSAGGVAPVELRMNRGSELAVRILDATTGAPLDGMVMLLDEQHKFVTSGNGLGEDGATHVWASPGRFTARVHANGYVDESVDASIPGPELRVPLSRAAALTISSRSGGRFRIGSTTVSEAGAGGISRMIVLRAGDRQTLNNLRAGALQVTKVSDDGKTVLNVYTAVLTAGQTATLDAD